MHKKLATLLVAAGLVLPMTYGAAQAAPAKAKAKSVRTIKNRGPVNKAPVAAPAANSTAGLYADRYYCEMGKSFTLYRDPDDKSYAILDHAGTKQRMYRVSSVTNAERFETNAKLTYIGAANLTQLIDFKNGKPILTECRNAEQQRFQAEMNRQKAEERAQAARKNKVIRKTSY